MKKHISIFLILALVLSIFYSSAGVARAASGIQMGISPSPVQVSAEGPVTFTASLTNTSTEDLAAGYSIRRIGGEKCKTIDTALPAGSSDDISFSYNVKPSEIGSNIVFGVFDGETLVEGSQCTVNVQKKALSVGIGASFSISPSSLAAAGDTVELKFTVENQGEAKLTNIIVKLGGKALNPEFSLAAKDKKNFSYNYKVTAAATLAPVVYYKVEGGTGETQQYPIASQELKLETRKVEMTLTSNTTTPQPGEEVTFTVNVVNQGNVPYSDVKLTMNGVEQEVPSSKLKEGGSFSEDYTQSFLASTDVTFELIMKDHKGEIVSISKSLSIELPVNDSDVTTKLKMDVEVDRPSLTSAGTVTFSGYIQNGTNYTLTNLVVTEATSGAEVYNFALLASLASTSFEYTVDINQTTTYNFQLTVTDTTGNSHTVSSAPVTVTITSAEATPGSSGEATATPSGIAIKPNGGSGLGTVLVIAIILIVLIIGVGVALLLLWRAQKNGKVIGRPGGLRLGGQRPNGPKPNGPGPNGPKPSGPRPSGPRPGAANKRPVAGPVKRKAPVSKGYRDRNSF